MNLTECIKNLCKNNGTTLNKLEIELGLAQGSIRKWGNSPPSADRLLNVANYFNVSLDWMMGRTTNIENTYEEKLLIEYYRSTNNTGKQITLKNARINAELMPLEQESYNLKKVSNLDTSASNS